MTWFDSTIPSMPAELERQSSNPLSCAGSSPAAGTIFNTCASSKRRIAPDSSSGNARFESEGAHQFVDVVKRLNTAVRKTVIRRRFESGRRLCLRSSKEEQRSRKPSTRVRFSLKAPISEGAARGRALSPEN
jgi:hypothetical protein